MELGQAEVYDWGEDAILIAYGTFSPPASRRRPS